MNAWMNEWIITEYVDKDKNIPLYRLIIIKNSVNPDYFLYIYVITRSTVFFRSRRHHPLLNVILNYTCFDLLHWYLIGRLVVQYLSY